MPRENIIAVTLRCIEPGSQVYVAYANINREDELYNINMVTGGTVKLYCREMVDIVIRIRKAGLLPLQMVLKTGLDDLDIQIQQREDKLYREDELYNEMKEEYGEATIRIKSPKKFKSYKTQNVITNEGLARSDELDIQKEAVMKANFVDKNFEPTTEKKIFRSEEPIEEEKEEEANYKFELDL
jgi:hypothetical protein